MNNQSAHRYISDVKRYNRVLLFAFINAPLKLHEIYYPEISKRIYVYRTQRIRSTREISLIWSARTYIKQTSQIMYDE